MAQSCFITLTLAGTDTGPFSLYTNVDGYSTPFASGINKSTLTSGYISSVVPDNTSIIRVHSQSIACDTYIDLSLPSTTTSTSTTTTSSTTSTSTTTTTTTSTSSTTSSTTSTTSSTTTSTSSTTSTSTSSTSTTSTSSTSTSSTTSTTTTTTSSSSTTTTSTTSSTTTTSSSTTSTSSTTTTTTSTSGGESLSRITSNNVYSGSDKMLIYTPPGYDDNADNYPLVLFYHGNGERGVATAGTYSVGTGNSSQTSWSGNMNNTNRLIHSEVIVEVEGVEVAWGHFGIFTGTGITGTYDYDDNSNSSYSLVFSSAPTSGDAISIKYVRSNLLGTGPFRFLNLGDQPTNIIYAAPQISRTETGFDPSTEWDAALDYLINQGYRIDTNRIYITGLSLGGDMIVKLLTDRNPGSGYTWAAFVCAAPGSDTGVPSSSPGTAYTNASNKGKLVVRGTSDSNGTFTGMMANNNGTDREFPVQMLQYWGIGHSSSLWDNKVYNRANRTDTTGAADFDYLNDFLLLFSLNGEERATLWVERAEITEDSGDYRVAARQVSLLSAGAAKSALESRLVSVSSAIGIMMVVDIGHSSFTSGGNYNNLTSTASSSSVSALKNLLTGDNLGWTLTCVNAPSASPAAVNNIGSSHRVTGRQFGFLMNTTRDGHEIDAAGTTGLYQISGLNNGKTYTLKIYAAMGQSSWSNRSEVEVVCDSTTKYAFDDPINFFAKDGAPSGAYTKFSNLSPISNIIEFTIKTRQTASTERVSYIQAVELIEHP